MDAEREPPWRELGCANWARDCGLVLTKQGRAYNLWESNAQVLVGVPLDEVERYLEHL